MRTITRKAIEAMLNGTSYCKSNTKVVNRTMYLFGNKIAWITENHILHISNCGYRTATTKERLNGLPLVSIRQKDGCWYLNGVYWDGRPIKVGSLSSLF